MANEPYLANNSALKKWKLYDDYQGAYEVHYNNPNIDSDNDTIAVYYGDEELNEEHTLNRMNNGEAGMGKFHLISHYDHGGAFGIGTSGRMKLEGIGREEMDALHNGNYLQIMYSTACKSGTFTLDAFAEHYINNPNGGGVATIANSASVGTSGLQQDKNLFHSIYGNMSPNSHLMGIAFTNARNGKPLLSYTKILTLLGDPTMMTWSATPGTFNLSAPSSITINNASDNTLTVGINALTQEATITLYKYNALGYPEVFSWQTIPAGGTSTQFNLNPDTPGTLLVTATAKNYIPPVPKNVNILMPQPHLYVTGFTISDSNGNNLIEPGENITLNVSLKNSGGASINNITTLLSCPSELATVTNASVNYAPTVNPGQAITLSGFTFTPLVEMGVDEIPDFIEFHLDINASNNYNHLDNFYLNIYSPKLNLGARNLTDNSGNPVTAFTPNQIVNAKIAIHNTGNIATGAMTAVLSSPLVDTGVIQITVPDGNYPDIPVYDEKLNLAPFKFKLLQTHSGAMPFTLTLSNAFGQSWAFNFDMSETCPAAISGFNFTSGPDRINLMWNPVTGIGGYNVYRSNTENGTYVRMNDYLVTGTSAYTDYEVQEATEYYYKISVVSLSGNECPLEAILTPDNKQGYLAWTSLEQHGGFPIPAYAKSGVSSPTLYDTDGDGTKEIFINYRQNGDDAGLIMGFHHDGEEIYDIDGNPTTISGFAVTDAGIWANSAIGDIDGDGHADVISVSRDNDSNKGKLYAYKTIDENNDNKPDKFWEDETINFLHRIGKNPVLYDLNNDGFLEIIVADESQRVHVYDKNKNIVPGWPKQIPGGDYSMGHIAIADLDNDGMGEIAFGVLYANGTQGGIYIWNHDGSAFTTNPFKVFANNERADGGITFADIDNDGEFELLTITRQSNTGRIYAFNLDASFVGANWDGDINFTLSSEWGVMPRISVGNLVGNENLEIAFGSKTNLYVLDSEGEPVNGFPIMNIGDSGSSAPILADIDGGEDIEIIVNVDGVINSYKNNGMECVGWRLQSNNLSPFVSSPSVDDIDDDRLNEIVITTEDCTTFVWDTAGSADKIEWGSYRADTYNTGTYKNGCLGGVDLYIKDSPEDEGIEPNIFSPNSWSSENIWIRHNPDNGTEHETPFYDGSSSNYVYVRVKNNSCMPSAGTEQLEVYWTKANIASSWPGSWNGTEMIEDTQLKQGDFIDTVSIPILQPGEEALIPIEWDTIPNPQDYEDEGVYQPWHFCLLARINSPNDPMAVTEDEFVHTNVLNNNNVASRNVEVIKVGDKIISGSVAVYNPLNSSQSFNLEFKADDREAGKKIFEEAEVYVILSEELYDAWVAGGNQSSNVNMASSLLMPYTFLITGDNAKLKNINLNSKQYSVMALKFNFLTKEVTSKEEFTYYAVQRKNGTNEIIGGNTFLIKKPNRDLFNANADDVRVNKNEIVTLEVDEIDENATYNWYNADGELIYTGTSISVIADIAKTYTVEIIAETDGFKDYTDVDVLLNPNRLIGIAPNPANTTTVISYTLNEVNSAYLRIVSYHENVMYNYIIDISQSESTIDISGYNTGLYVVSLICDGQIVDSKTLIKQ